MDKELKLSDLTENDASLIKTYAWNVRLLSSCSFSSPRRPGVALGLSQGQHGRAYRDLCRQFGLLNHREVEHLIDTDSGETELFLPAVIGKFPITFFVPRFLFTVLPNDFTAEEMRWFLRYPEALSDVDFIFGAYSGISSN